MKRMFVTVALILIASIALARSDGIYNPSSNSIGDYQGIDSNAATGGGGGANFRITDVPAFRITDTGASRIISP